MTLTEKILAILVFWIACSVGGYWMGYNHAKDRFEAEKLGSVERAIEQAKELAQEDAQIVSAGEQARIIRQTEKQIVYKEVIRHAQTLPDPPECALDPDRVRNINRAWGNPAADPGEPAHGVPGSAAPQQRQPLGGGALGGGSGLRLPGLRGGQEEPQPGGAEAAAPAGRGPG